MSEFDDHINDLFSSTNIDDIYFDIATDNNNNTEIIEFIAENITTKFLKPLS
jgi:hypothetical protein